MEHSSYQVMEHFGTLQGEGYYTGRAAYFIRLSGCDIGCVWCDVKESWDVGAGKSYSLEEIKGLSEGFDFIVLTGGEPAMHDLRALTDMLHKEQKYISLETSGCYELNGAVDWYTFSPKKFKKPHPEAYQKADELKVVIYHPSDLAWAEEHAKQVNDQCLLYVQPEWSKKDQLQEQIIDFITRNPRWRLSLQTHKFLNIP
jgi:organic radical activating enzyme